MLRDAAIRSWPSIKYSLNRMVLTNPRSSVSYALSGTRLSDGQRRVVEQLERDGVAFSTFAEVIDDGALWPALQTAVDTFATSEFVRTASDQWLRGERRGARKDYLVRLFGDGAAVDLSDKWLAFGLHDSVLKVVNAYLGLFSRLMAFDLWYTLPTPDDRAPSGSQIWHRDPEDRRMLKVFLYFSDVSADAGALEYIKGTRLGEPRGPKRYAGDGWKAPALQPARDAERVLCAGPRGTLLFCDTTGLHRGGYAKQARVLANWLFTSPATLYRRRFRINGGGDLSHLGPAARWALS